MKKYLFLCLVIGLAASIPAFTANSELPNVNSQNGKVSITDPTLTNSEDGEEASEDGEEAKEDKLGLIPDSVAMSLDFTEDANIMPADFRGGDPDKTKVHVLEDVYYAKHEHSLIYEGDSEGIASDTSFSGTPSMSWTQSIVGKDGSLSDELKETKNTDMASDDGHFYLPAEYEIGNHGAREVEVDGEKKTVTSTQTLGVIAHDCTAPDVWIAFQEKVGDTNSFSENKNELGQKLRKVMENTINIGRPSENEKTDNMSYLCVDEGLSDERDKEPWKKTARVTSVGSMFNEDGKIEVKSELVKSGLIDKDTQLRLVYVTPIENNEYDENLKTSVENVQKVLNGIYVRRNVPFIFAAEAIDNCTEREIGVEKAVEARLEYDDGKEIDESNPILQSDGSYMIRVANYPRENYKDQPDYYFVALSKDLSGNQTMMKIPVYVVESDATFETSAK